jgi:hypothetical protein
MLCRTTVVSLISLACVALNVGCAGWEEEIPTPEAPSSPAVVAAQKAPEAQSEASVAAADTAREVNEPVADDAETLKAKGFARQFQWTKTPSLRMAPKDAVVAGVGDEGFVASVRIDVDKTSKRWTLAAMSPGSASLGPSITVRAAMPKAGTYAAKYGDHDGSWFQAPKPGQKAATENVNSKCSYTLEIKKVTLSKDGQSGTASGRFVTVFDNVDGPKLWAAGTFTDAPIAIN